MHLNYKEDNFNPFSTLCTQECEISIYSLLNALIKEFLIIFIRGTYLYQAEHNYYNSIHKEIISQGDNTQITIYTQNLYKYLFSNAHRLELIE